MRDDLIFSADYSRILASVLNLSQRELGPLLAGTSLSADAFLALEGYISWPDQHRIIENALALAAEPGLGLRAGERYSLMSHGLMGVAAMSSPTVLQAIQTLVQFHPTRAQFARLQLERTDTQLLFGFELTIEPDAVANFLLEALLVSQLSTLTFLLGDQDHQVAVELAMPQPSYHEMFRQRVPGPLTFGCDRNLFILPAAFGDITIPTHDANLQQWAVQQCQQQIGQLQTPATFRDRTLAILRQASASEMGQDQIAYLLNVSPRTLLRRLKEEGVTYKALVDQEQKRLARHYLEHTHLTMETIAEQMGYHDLSSFRRAFKRWFDMLPSQYPR